MQDLDDQRAGDNGPAIGRFVHGVFLDALAGPGGVWDLLAVRLQAIPEYVELFMAAYPDTVTDASDITYVHAANASRETRKVLLKR